jgi:hypothetical protein
MEGNDFQELKDSIRLRDQRETIKPLDGKILDGRNRYRACLALGIEPRTEDLPPDTDALAYVLDANLRRRHLPDVQRAFVAAQVMNMRRGGDRGNQHTGGKPPIGGLPGQPPASGAEAAKRFDVPERTIEKAKRIQDKGVPELKEAVLDGDLSMNAADAIAGLPKEDQPSAIKEAKANRSGKRSSGKRSSGKRSSSNGEKPAPSANGTTKTKGTPVGMIRAREAIDILVLIPKNDALRRRGFQHVTDWIKSNR